MHLLFCRCNFDWQLFFDFQIRKDSSVLIENVSLVINVFNIGHNGNITQSSIHGQPHRQTVEFIRNCIAEGTNTSLNGGGLIQESTGICNLAEGCVKLEEPYKDPPLGWIACVNGDVIPFGIQSTTLEVSKFGGIYVLHFSLV